MDLSRRLGRRALLSALGITFAGTWLAPNLAFAKKRRRKPKRAAPAPAAEASATPSGDALQEAELTQRDGVWHLKNKSNTQRIVVIIRYSAPDSRGPSIHALSLEPSQELSLGVKQPEGTRKPVITVVAAQYG